MPRKTPKQLHELLFELKPNMQYEYPEFIDSYDFIEAAKELRGRTSRLYLSARPDGLDPSITIYTLWLDRPTLQPEEMNDWNHNKRIAVYGTNMEADEQSNQDDEICQSITNKLLTPEINEKYHTKIYRIR